MTVADKKLMDNPILDAETEVRKLKNGGYKFNARAILTSAAAATAINVLAKEVLETIKSNGQVFIEGIRAVVNGATAWGTTATVELKTTADTPIAVAQIAVALLTADAIVETGDFTLEAGMGDLNAEGEGITVEGNANGTGSDLIVTIWGVIK